MQKLLVMTDLHITGGDDPIIGLDPMARFADVLTTALTDHPDAIALILMGDLTHHGQSDQYERLSAALADVAIPIIPMMGNHDRRDAFLRIFPDAPQDAGFIQTIRDLPHHRIITLDTLDGPPYPDGHHSGRLCPARITWLTHALDTCGDRIPLVFAHHPPFVTGIVGMDAIGLADGDAVIDLLAQNPKTHLFCGHIHRTISGSTRGVAWTMFKSPCHQGVLDLDTADSSLSIDEPGAYGVLILPRDGVVAHSQDVGIGGAVVRDYGSVTDAGKKPAFR